jgi:hypothetical protein
VPHRSRVATSRARRGVGRLAFALLLCTTARVAHAQQARPRDCNLARQAYDDPFADSRGWHMRRYQWHTFYAGLSVATAEVIHRTTHMPRWASAATATVAIGLVPHVRGVIRHRYPFDARDWAFDLVNRSAPLFVWRATRPQPWASRAATAAGYAASYLSLACYASP